MNEERKIQTEQQENKNETRTSPQTSLSIKKRSTGIITSIVIILAVICMAIYWCALHHIILTKNGTAIIEKRFIGFHDTVVDIREWTYREFEAHPDLSIAMEQQGYDDLIVRASTDSFAYRISRSLQEIAKNIEMAAKKTSKSTEEWIRYVCQYWTDVFEKK